jgi:hypothetical protein
MAGEKFLQHDGSGGFQEVEAVQTGGAPNADKILPLDASGRVPANALPTGVGADTQTIEASEALSAGDIVNIWEDTGVAKVRKADATTAGKEADGFVLAASSTGNTATVYFEGNNEQVSGLTPGLPVYLDTTAGGLTQTPPAASGNVVQSLGKASSATSFNFEPQTPIRLA